MKKSPAGIFRVGTSNIVVPGNKQSFPEAFRSTTRLHYYATLFNSLEVNSSFYKIPQRTTFEKWAMDVPRDFHFTVKLWRGITHGKGLVYDPHDIDRFMKAVNGLGDRKGCLLIQFPASIGFDHLGKVEKMLQRVQEAGGNEWRKAVEFRHRNWYVEDTNKMLDRFDAALVLHDMPASAPTQVDDAAGFVFLRFHGVKGDYRGGYEMNFLEDRARQIGHWLKKGKDVYAYFNNTIGDAYDNARSLQRLLR